MAGSRFWAVAEREALLAVLLTAYAIVVLRAIPHQLVQDSWLTLVSGREIAEHGIPRTDRLAAWTSGVPWIDQQWLAQLAFYAAHAAGGMHLVMLFHASLLIATLALGLAAARSLGASVTSVSLVAVVALSMAPWALQMRAQALALPLFVSLLWLLAADSRAPSRRVLIVFPLLILWANIHGTVVLAAGLVALRGIALLVGRHQPPARLRATALICVPFGTLVASPYTTELVGYYRTMVVNPTLRTFVTEWAPSTPSALTIGFYVGAFATVALLGRYRAALTGFEQLALLIVLFSGLAAIRSILWFGLAALLLVPQLVDEALSPWRPRAHQRLRSAAVVVCGVVLVCSFAVVASRPAAWFTSQWPHAGAATLAKVMEARPNAVLLADDRYADWLLWEHPQLVGRVAYDVRFELLTQDQLHGLLAYRRVTGTGWDDVAVGSAVVAFDPREQRAEHQQAVLESGFSEVYRDDKLFVAAR